MTKKKKNFALHLISGSCNSPISNAVILLWPYAFKSLDIHIRKHINML